MNRSLRSELQATLLSALGDEGFRALTKQFGGTRIYVPIHPREDDPLVRLCGWEAAAKAARRLGGEKIDIPNHAARRRRRQILEMRSQGCSCRAIAKGLGCTTRWVQRVIASRGSGEL